MTLYGMAETGRASRPHLVDGAGLFDCRRAGTKLYKRPNHFLVVLCQGDPMATVPVEDQIKIPGNVATLTAFRHWSLSESFPKRGRIDWVRLTPKAGGEADRFVELEGGPELVVEIVSDASVGKDRRRLPPAYFAAGVTEFWLIDARGPELEFVIHHRGGSGFVPVTVGADGGQPSTVFSCGFRLIRGRNARGRYFYDLIVVDAAPDRE